MLSCATLIPKPADADDSYRRPQVYRNSTFAARQLIDSYNFGQVLRFNRIVDRCEWVGDEEAHSDAVVLQSGMKVDAALGHICAGRDLFEILGVKVGRSNAQFPSKFRPRICSLLNFDGHSDFRARRISCTTLFQIAGLPSVQN